MGLFLLQTSQLCSVEVLGFSLVSLKKKNELTVLSNSLLKINLHFKFLLYSNIVLLRWWRCLNLLLNHPLYFFHLGSAPECEVRLTDSRKIIMKLYVFLVNTGTTLTFDTELTVQTWVVFHFSLVFHPKFIPYFKKISYCDGGRHSQ